MISLVLIVPALALALGAITPASAAPPETVEQAAASLEKLVITPFREQLQEKDGKAKAHADAIEAGKVYEVKGPGFGADKENRHVREHGLDYAPGWAIWVVRPFEDDYFTTRQTRYELLGWKWTPGREGEEALVTYSETMFLKNAPSLAEVVSEPWLRWISVNHHVRAVRGAGGWEVEEASEPTPSLDPNKKRDLYEVHPVDRPTPTPAS